MARRRLGEILIEAGVLTEEKLRSALTEQRRWGGPLGRLLVEMRLISEEALVAALSKQLNLPAIDLTTLRIAQAVLDVVSIDLCEQHSILPVKLEGKFLDVAMADPTNLGIIDELRIRTRLNVRPYLAGPKAIERAIGIAYRGESLDPDPGRFSLEYDGRAQPFDPTGGAPGAAPGPTGPTHQPPRVHAEPLTDLAAERDLELSALQARVQHLEALLARDEDVLRKLLALLVEKGLCTRDEILDRIR